MSLTNAGKTLTASEEIIRLLTLLTDQNRVLIEQARYQSQVLHELQKRSQ